MNIEKINEIKDDIEKLEQVNHLEVFNILKNQNIPYDSNRNGIFFNLTNVDVKILEKLEKYIEYKKNQKKILSKDEEIKEQYKKDFFN